MGKSTDALSTWRLRQNGIRPKRGTDGRPGEVGLYHKKRHTCEEPNVPYQTSPEAVWKPSFWN